MIKSAFFILSLFMANLAVAENDEKFSAAQQAFYSGDFKTAKTIFLQAAEQGSVEAEYFLGLIAKNDADRADYQAAKSHFINAALLNHVQAMWELGVLYENGEGVAQNQFTAMDWFRKSELAAGTVAPDSFYINDHSGELIEVSVSQYLEYLTQQAQSGRTEAKFALAKIYDRGVITAANLTHAFNWYLSAANDGHVKAAQLVSYFYCRGIAVARDPKQANAWVKASGYSKSCD